MCSGGGSDALRGRGCGRPRPGSNTVRRTGAGPATHRGAHHRWRDARLGRRQRSAAGGNSGAPRPRCRSGAQGKWAVEAAATEALRSLVLGKSIELAFAGERDRPLRPPAGAWPSDRGRAAALGAGASAGSRASPAPTCRPATAPAPTSCWPQSVQRARPVAACGRRPPTIPATPTMQPSCCATTPGFRSSRARSCAWRRCEG